MFKQFSSAKDPISSYTHFLGAVFSLFATVIMISHYHSSQIDDTTLLIGVVLFGVSLVALYSASCIYHYVQGSDDLMVRLRKLDHAMIYMLIAGSYTPIAAKFLVGESRTVFLIGIWTAAILGIIIKVLWLDAPRWLYTSLYVVMGWALLFDIESFSRIPSNCLALIAAGGISYTVGAVVYILKKPVLSEAFGFHEIFHLFILVGSAFHVATVLLYVI